MPFSQPSATEAGRSLEFDVSRVYVISSGTVRADRALSPNGPETQI